MKYKLHEICNLISEKTSANGLTNTNMYISTENMLPNKNGVVAPVSVPTNGKVTAYKRNDVLVSNIRPYFKKIWFALNDGSCSNDVLVFRAKDGISPDFLHYILADDAFFDYAMKTSKGTKMPRGDKKAIMEYEVSKMDFDTQQRASIILRLIDKKISINNKINENLEQQAQAIFKSWFVDFEPFGGVMPDDWKSGTFSDIIISTLSGDWGKETLTGNYTEQVYCIRGADIPEIRAGNKGKMPTRYILPKNFKAKQLTANDIVIEISGGSPTQSTGRVCYISHALLDRYDNGMVCTNFCRAIKPNRKYSIFMYYYWQYLYDINIFFLYENGTTGIKNLDLSGFIETQEIVIPSLLYVEKFNSICTPIFEQIFKNGLENERLSVLRDTLLPKLMNGEIDVSKIKI